MAIQRENSPYSAALTGCTFMFYEMNRCLPLLMDANAEELLKLEVEQNKSRGYISVVETTYGKLTHIKETICC